MKIKFLTAVAVAVCGALPAIAQQVQIDETFHLHTLNWENGNGSTMVRWRPVIIDGNIAICSAYATRGGRKYSSLSRQAVADMRIEQNGQTILPSLRFSSIQGSRAYGQNMVGTNATCAVTSTPGTPADFAALRADITPRNYRP